MGSWSYYCAICGSTFHGPDLISRKQRTPRFLFRQQRDAAFNKLTSTSPTNKIDFRTFNAETAAGENNLDAESLPSEDEDNTYDPCIISKEDAAWSEDLQCLGVNFEHRPRRAFLSDIGGDLDLDLDVLWGVFRHLQDYAQLDIDYGRPGPPQDQHWLVNSGEELFIADPGKRVHIHDNVNHMWDEMVSSVEVSNSNSNSHTMENSSDPFVLLLEVLPLLTSQLYPESLLNLISASPSLRRGLGGNFAYWRRRFETDMPWFFEVHSFLDSLGTVAVGVPKISFSHLFAWAYHTTTPRVGIKGPFMGVANRRRIWGYRLESESESESEVEVEEAQSQ
ncbi:Aryl-alcohol dehydrogenase [Penicillium manginii]|uniref:Aryl-alcohol dehydrogenase n=1 Tax=Penicillium manginii TaxID=203109 RepID=UPI0025479A34|nr:Aryl-alcohol dehydrogenase [Penicillium manginii]KAJ5767883.1 Aryl-alcohol dehydrogenase [Penicillium manginii]